MKKYKVLFEEMKAIVTLDGIVVRTYERFSCIEEGQFRRCVLGENVKSLR
jgi:hypothetical protein